MLANSLVVGKLSYLLPLWGGATRNYVRKGQSVLKLGSKVCDEGEQEDEDKRPDDDV